MLDEINLKYSSFHDAKISKVNLIDENDSSKIELMISCMNIQNDYQFEKVKIVFFDIVFLNLKFQKNMGILSLFATLIKEENELITFDFDCIYFDENLLKENPNSEFIIKCKKVTYEVIS